MHFKKTALAGLAVLSGAALGLLLKQAYWNFNFPPLDDWILGILASSTGRELNAHLPREFAIFLILLARALPWSVTMGAMAGAVLVRIKYQRLFCYSTLLFPLIESLLVYLAISDFVPGVSGAITEGLWTRFAEHRQLNLAIYAWFFLALYLSFIAMKRFAPQGITSGRRDAIDD